MAVTMVQSQNALVSIDKAATTVSIIYEGTEEAAKDSYYDHFDRCIVVENHDLPTWLTIGKDVCFRRYDFCVRTK